MKKISLTQKKIIIVSVAVFFVFSLAWILVYVPARKKINRLKDKIAGTKKQIQEIEEMIGEDKTMADGIMALEEKSRKIDAKFPQREEESIGMLADLTQGRDVAVLSTRVQARRVFTTADKQEVRIEGKKGQQVTIMIEMQGNYKGLVEYIESLRESLPAYVSIENLRINKNSSGEFALRIAITLSIYLLV